MNINIIQSRIIKRICLLIGITMILMGFKFEALANDSLKISSNNIVSDKEISALEKAMGTRGIAGKIRVEILYDHNDSPNYVIGTTDAGYLILDRNTFACMESGEVNPYASNSEYDGIKYYGGVLNYYIKYNDAYFDICQNKIISDISYYDYLDDTANRNINMSDAQFSAAATSANATVTTTEILPSNLSRIQRRAFGRNNDNTCTAVACTLVLNYLDFLNDDIVPNKYELELLVTDDGSKVATKHPKAHAFHRFLVDDCGMGAASYANAVIDGIDEYRESDNTIGGTEIEAEWTLNILTNFGINEILADKPTMLTSTIAGEYSWHTMAVYGFRRYSDNSLEWLVHTGWYSSLVYDDGVYRMPQIWVPASTATYLYRFNYVE